jgi:hypothetical protein
MRHSSKLALNPCIQPSYQPRGLTTVRVFRVSSPSHNSLYSFFSKPIPCSRLSLSFADVISPNLRVFAVISVVDEVNNNPESSLLTTMAFQIIAGLEFSGIIAKRGLAINKLFLCIDRGSLCIQQHATQESIWRIALFERCEATTGEPFIAVDVGTIMNIERSIARSQQVVGMQLWFDDVFSRNCNYPRIDSLDFIGRSNRGTTSSRER